jgi:hypothetical protein
MLHAKHVYSEKFTFHSLYSEVSTKKDTYFNFEDVSNFDSEKQFSIQHNKNDTQFERNLLVKFQDVCKFPDYFNNLIFPGQVGLIVKKGKRPFGLCL